MSSNYGKKIVVLKEIAASGVAVEVGATSDRVVGKVLCILLITEVFERVGPQKIAHGSEGRRLFEAIQLK